MHTFIFFTLSLKIDLYEIGIEITIPISEMGILRQIWMIRGWAGSGKDTVAGILLKKLQNAEQSAFASAVKDEVAAMYDIDRASMDTQEGKARKIQLPDGRICTLRELIISYAESEKFRQYDLHLWSRRMNPSDVTENWILSDWRFSDEYVWLRERFPWTHIRTIHVVRDSIIPLDTDTEHYLDTTPTEFTIHNSGTLQDLEKEIDKILINVPKDHKCQYP